ncbi:hypothetical protein A1Q2_00783 [Trichosporon asahii var. asahii CBS 8904]|uniref:RNA polymerase Rpb4/RPC9 core domain-containing protein n=2 Tax=Trichosporon asahii var. asahii TaxID=189963 RepID=K1VZB9_TRIAC|nr:hypothetical protein A1Q1_05449 [Trichosporon asahii var. asahii CBS 2479]EJT52239.1 hypothetical protein A1Q1_05449 [Trichosporon asahii var. asahii CBS 2479]EKD04922.1 hypothetical protein A1Q2_00783 [Trichosporon asahii var. asahii CBS 8904]
MEDTKPTQAQLAQPRPVEKHRRRGALTADFAANGEALTLAEVRQLLSISRDQVGAPPAPDNKVYKSTITYVDEFANMDASLCEGMRGALMARPGFLNNFEIAQIMHLRPERVEVAVALIPSLERYAQGDESEEYLAGLLEEVRTIARYGAGV